MQRHNTKMPPQYERWLPRNSERYYLILGNGTIQSFYWRGTEFDHQAWSFGNCFRRRRDVAQARDQVKEVLLTFHQDHASSRMAKLLIRTGGACSPLSVLLTSTDVSFLEKKL